MNATQFPLTARLYGAYDEITMELVFAVEACDEDEAFVRVEMARRILCVSDSPPLIVEQLRTQPDGMPIFIGHFFDEALSLETNP